MDKSSRTRVRCDPGKEVKVETKKDTEGVEERRGPCVGTLSNKWGCVGTHLFPGVSIISEAQ